MENQRRYAKTTKGINEIGRRQHNLTGKVRMMLILVDPSKTEEQLRMQAARIGAPADCLETMAGNGNIAPVQTATTCGIVPGVPQANGTLASEPTMDVAHVARAVLYMASLPLDANVLFLTVMATQMPFVGRG